VVDRRLARVHSTHGPIVILPSRGSVLVAHTDSNPFYRPREGGVLELRVRFCLGTQKYKAERFQV